MILEKYTAGQEKNGAYEAIRGMMEGFDTDKSYADMMRLRISGALAEECHDVYYVAHESGRGLSRHWMGWGKHADAIGNWGNFYTDEACRGKGIGGQLLRFWYEDFQACADVPLGFFCTVATRELTDLYRRFGFRPAVEGTDCGYLYRPNGDSPATFRAFCERYYRPSDVLYHRRASAGYRHEIDCLLRFVYRDMGLPFGVGGLKSVEEGLLYCPERCGMLFSKDGRCVGWSVDGNIQVHPMYLDSAVRRDDGQ